MSRYAVIDFGSNTIRLCIYALPDALFDSLTKKDITVLLNYKEMAGISSYVKNGKLSEKGIKKASRILREQIERASYFSPDAVRVFATAVLRNAKNSESAKQAIEKNCGVPITLLTNEEEALLGLAGASLDGSIETATLVDIGGGSTELTALSKGKLQAATSLPLGSLSSFTQYVSGILPSTSEMAAIAE
ncbi:MAG: exopolyphosphatase, partial [Eggerthella sp.]|nr:exopolyphosphatase [Eggerthella sp.]